MDILKTYIDSFTHLKLIMRLQSMIDSLEKLI